MHTPTPTPTPSDDDDDEGDDTPPEDNGDDTPNESGGHHMECPYCGFNSEHQLCDYCKAMIPETEKKAVEKEKSNGKETIEEAN